MYSKRIDSGKKVPGGIPALFSFFSFYFFCLGVIYGEFSFAIYFVVNYTFLARLIHAFNFQKDERIFRKMVVKKKRNKKRKESCIKNYQKKVNYLITYSSYQTRLRLRI